MKKLLILSALFLIISRIASSQITLEIEITGLRNDRGLIMFQLFDENQNVIRQEKGVIKDQKSLITIKDLKPGRYAFRYFHDENLSGIMETNAIGIPKEGYGFSGNGAGPFGPRPFKEWLFDLKENMKIVIKTR